MSETECGKPITDLSRRVVSLAREIERLGPGQYMIVLNKPDLQAQSWSVEIIRTDTIRTMELPKREISLNPV